MKLTYITPASRVINLEPMQMLAASDPTVKIVDDEAKSIDPSASFSEGKGWSSEGWDNED
ncbi:hypothetical protein [Prevotellamassilia timonensis]|uniref:hypothetical protein n=1 Tax=Prevotellamassilia timonensis TaxID=1852370 RepID=UPI00307CCE5B